MLYCFQQWQQQLHGDPDGWSRPDRPGQLSDDPSGASLLHRRAVPNQERQLQFILLQSASIKRNICKPTFIRKKEMLSIFTRASSSRASHLLFLVKKNSDNLQFDCQNQSPRTSLFPINRKLNNVVAIKSWFTLSLKSLRLLKNCHYTLTLNACLYTCL